ncbi:MAG: vanadium-dependent haloperoxidase [Pseudomonadota bacterium]
MSQKSRVEDVRKFRVDAADLAASRKPVTHQSNGEEDEATAAAEGFPMSFTKGLEHDQATGRVVDPAQYTAFVAAIDGGTSPAFSDGSITVSGQKKRKWEAPTAGFVSDLQGPDAQAVTMPPAPKLGSDELTFEMAEVYELAILRDVPFAAFRDGGHAQSAAVTGSVARLSKLPYANTRPSDGLTAQNVFRGFAAGEDVGPLLSQFLLIGSPDYSRAGAKDITGGQIQYGAQTIDQRVPLAIPRKDFMTTRDSWREVQNGADTRVGMQAQLFEQDEPRRFMATPRDLATYVHDDALYQAYLNACLLLLASGMPFDPGFSDLHGVGRDDLQAGGFALWGGPHILSLVTEVATRGLKAVRWQKFNIHRRLRPEALAGRLEYLPAETKTDDSTDARLAKMQQDLLDAGTLTEIRALNARNNATHFSDEGETDLLPMAFQEGSPMHPAYGAGHATVAGACVTILKAFFDTSRELRMDDKGRPNFVLAGSSGDPWAFVASDDGSELVPYALAEGEVLTLESELNKLAGNISIGRNMAGVHYYTDYSESVLMGEKIAVGMLEEQALGYFKEDFIQRLTTFQGEVITIGKAGALKADGTFYLERNKP